MLLLLTNLDLNVLTSQAQELNLLMTYSVALAMSTVLVHSPLAMDYPLQLETSLRHYQTLLRVRSVLLSNNQRINIMMNIFESHASVRPSAGNSER